MGSSSVCQIREEIEHFGIKIYQFPDCDSDEDEDFKLQDQALKVGPPQGIPFPSFFLGQKRRVEFLYKDRLLGRRRTLASYSEAEKMKIEVERNR